LICAFHHNCENPIPWSPKGNLEYGWVSCAHEIDDEKHWVNCHVSPDGQAFTVRLNPDHRQLRSRPLELYELNPSLVVHWSEQYLLGLADQPAVRTLLATHGIPEAAPFEVPKFVLERSCGEKVAGIAKGADLIQMSSWVLHSRNETEATLRHECAHCICSMCGLKEPDSHGDNFALVLKTIAPTTWEQDWYCNPTLAMKSAREAIHGVAE
jgi:hypothetical protein